MPAAERYILDTSAVLTLTDQEDGWEKVEDLLDRATGGEIEVGVCAVSLMELYYITLQEQGDDRAVQPEFETLAGEIPLLSLPYKAAALPGEAH